jgi:tellurite resistance protein
VVLNRYTTLLAGRHAQTVFRNDARVIELAENLVKRSQYPQLLLWVAWLVIDANGKSTDEESLLMQQLVRIARDKHQVVDQDLADLVDLDTADVWRRLDAEPRDLNELLDAAIKVAEVDGDLNKREKAVISQLRERCVRADAESA